MGCGYFSWLKGRQDWTCPTKDSMGKSIKDFNFRTAGNLRQRRHGFDFFVCQHWLHVNYMLTIYVYIYNHICIYIYNHIYIYIQYIYIYSIYIYIFNIYIYIYIYSIYIYKYAHNITYCNMYIYMYIYMLPIWNATRPQRPQLCWSCSLRSPGASRSLFTSSQFESQRGSEWSRFHWIGLREILQEIIDFPIQYGAFWLRFSLKPIRWHLHSKSWLSESCRHFPFTGSRWWSVLCWCKRGFACAQSGKGAE